VRHRTRLKNEVHSILHAHLIPKCPHADLFNARGRTWSDAQPLPQDERTAIDRHVRELDLAEDLAMLDRQIAQDAIDDPAVNRSMTMRAKGSVRGQSEVRGGPGCLNRFSASISGASVRVRPPSGVAAG
jgi:transposase